MLAMEDSDLQIRGGGGVGSGLQNLFSALRASVWSKNKGGWGVPGPPRHILGRHIFETEAAILSLIPK